jgi:hypothetical protein
VTKVETRMKKYVYLISAGSYEDYRVLRVYEDEHVARRLVLRINERSLRRGHEIDVKSDQRYVNEKWRCVGSFEECPSCQHYVSTSLDNFVVRVEALPADRRHVLAS